MIMIVSYQIWWSVSNVVDFRFCTMPSDITLPYLSLVLSHPSWLIVLEYRTGDIANDYYWECRLWALIATPLQIGVEPPNILVATSAHWGNRKQGQGSSATTHFHWAWQTRCLAFFGLGENGGLWYNHCYWWEWVLVRPHPLAATLNIKLPQRMHTDHS